MKERLIKKLITTVKCNSCGEHYGIDNIEIIGNQGKTWYLNVFCPTCNRGAFVAAIIKEEKTHKIITDRTEEEFMAATPADTINSNDLIDLHSFLKDFDGDFVKLFKYI